LYWGREKKRGAEGTEIETLNASRGEEFGIGWHIPYLAVERRLNSSSRVRSRTPAENAFGVFRLEEHV